MNPVMFCKPLKRTPSVCSSIHLGFTQDSFQERKGLKAKTKQKGSELMSDGRGNEYDSMIREYRP